MERAGEDAVIAEAVAHMDVVVTKNRLAMDIIGEVIIVTMIGGGDLEAEAQEEEVDKVEVLQGGEIGVQVGKAVPREGQRLNNGIGRENIMTLERMSILA